MKGFPRLAAGLVMAFAVAVVSCAPELEFVDYRPGNAGNAEVYRSDGNLAVNFSSKAGTVSVELNSSGKWSAALVNDRASQWCSISATEGSKGKVTIIIKVAENTGYDERSASINFVCKDLTRTIVVTQKQKDALLISSKRVDVGMEGGLITIAVGTNVEYEFAVSQDAQSWIIPAGTKSLATSEVAFKVTANENVAKRNGQIVFTSAAGKEVVNVYQDGETPSLVVSASETQLGDEPGALTVEVRSNMDVGVEIQPGCTWLTELKTKAISTNTYFFTVARNSGRRIREAWIAFKNENYSCFDTVRVSQDYHRILLANEQLRSPSRGHRFELKTVGSDPDLYSLALSHRWLSLAGQESSEDGCHFLVEVQPAYEGEEPREGTVLVYEIGYDEPDTVQVIQYQPLPVFAFTCAARQVSLPEIEAQDPVGFVYWDEQTMDPYYQGLVHTYPDNSEHSVSVEMGGIIRIPFKKLVDGMTVDFSKMKEQ